MLLTAVFGPIGMAAASSWTCGTPAILEQTLAIPPAVLPDPGPPSPDKDLRDMYGVSNSLESDNFVARWGDSGGISEDNVETMLGDFEVAWSVQIDDMDHPVPHGADLYKVNVYIGNTGEGPTISGGVAGYATDDSAGYPMVVMSPHFVQRGTGAFTSNSDVDELSNVRWYWEATAEWIEAEVYADEPEHAHELAGFAILRHLALNFYQYPEWAGDLQELHHYGAFIFPRYLTEHVGDWRLIRDSWVEPTSEDPLESLEDALADLGYELDHEIALFAAHNATWDYEHGDWSAGSKGMDADWRVAVVVSVGDTREYTVLEGASIEHEIGDVSDATSVHVAVVPSASGRLNGETFDYTFRLYFTDGGHSETG